jgi:hypothetical protein
VALILVFKTNTGSMFGRKPTTRRSNKKAVTRLVAIVVCLTALNPATVHSNLAVHGFSVDCKSATSHRHRASIVKVQGNLNDDDNKEQQHDGNARSNQTISAIFDRFSNPIIDDPAMPLTEAGLVQIVAPTLQLFWIVSLDSPYPSWAQPLVDTTFTSRGAFLAPTLIHGAGLACCWLMGCLAAKAYEKQNFRVNNNNNENVGTGDYGPIISSTIQAGAFACGLLILATQFDLFQEFHGYVQFGESAITDARIYRALVEVINDIFFEFVVLMSWRLFRSNFD